METKTESYCPDNLLAVVAHLHDAAAPGIFTGQVMMVAVAAQFKQHQSAQYMVAVPAMLRHGTFVISIGPLFALQAVMFNIVHCFKQ